MHGFLGLPPDWDILTLPHHPVNLWEKPILPFRRWADAFNEAIDTPSILMGYSLGGRLALNALLQKPSNWKAAIFISTHTGISSTHEKMQRLDADEEWARRFAEEPWEQLMSRWNAQPALANSTKLARHENDFSRPLLCQALKTWSLGRQDELSAPLSGLDLPILWLAGENDPKFAAIALKQRFKHSASAMRLIPGAGHRVPWENPLDFNKTVLNFLEESYAYEKVNLAPH